MTNSYCQPSESIFWFPIAPGIETLPPIPAEIINESPLPANGVPVPSGFDIHNPDLCELFDVILPTGIDPVYYATINPDVIVPPYNQIVIYDARIRLRMPLEKIPYKVKNTTDLVITLKPSITIYDYPPIAIISTRAIVSDIQYVLIDYQVVILVTRSKVSAEKAFIPLVLLHLNGDDGVLLTSGNIKNDGSLAAAISVYQAPIYQTQYAKFNGSSAYFYDQPSVITVTHPTLAIPVSGMEFTISGWVWIDPGSTSDQQLLWSPGGSGAPSNEGVFLQVGNYSKYLSIVANDTYDTRYFGDYYANYKGTWLYWALRKQSSAGLWYYTISDGTNNIWTGQFTVSATNGVFWYNQDGIHLFGGRPSASSNILQGAMNEIAIFAGDTGVELLSNVPVEQYSPRSTHTSITISVRSVTVAIFQQMYLEYTAIIPISLRLIKKTESIVKVLRYTGNGVSGRSLITSDVSPDFVWVKSTDYGSGPIYLDSVRGGNTFNYWNSYYPDNTNLTITSFNSNGINVSATSSINANSYTYHLIAFGNTGGTYIDSSGTAPVSIKTNTDFGFSICRWTGTGTSGSTPVYVPHGLGAAPELLIVKVNYYTYEPFMFGTILGEDKGLGDLDSTSSSPSNFYDVSFTSQYVVSAYNNSYYFFNSSYSAMMYCFRSVAGATKISKYTGYFSASKFVALDFKPSLVLVKQITGSTYDRSWMAYSRDIGYSWRPFEYTIDSAYTTDITLYDDGFGFPAGSIWNRTGQSYLYMAFKDISA